MEDSRILERLIFSLRHTEQDNLGGFPKIVARRTNEIADIFNEENARAAKSHLVQMAIHHARVQVTGAAGNNLPNRKAVTRKPPRIIVGLEIAGENGHGVLLGKRRQRFFQKCGLARARRTDQVDAENSFVAIALAQSRGQSIILAEHLFFYGLAHGSSNSR